jgi:uncharacterized protein (DUF885 family)
MCAKPGEAMMDTCVPDMSEIMGRRASELRDLFERYDRDQAALGRRHSVAICPTRRARFRSFHAQWRSALDAVDFDALSCDGRMDYLLFQNLLERKLRQLDRDEVLAAETAPLLPFEVPILDLQEARRRFDTLDPQAAGAVLASLDKQVQEVRKTVTAEKCAKTIAHRAAKRLDELLKTLEDWYKHYSGYDPRFTWWARNPYEKTAESVKNYAKFLREEIVGAKPGEEEPIVGDPIGRESLLADLRSEMIPYSPEELVALAQRELDWCHAEMCRASQELGFGDDWRKTIEHVKNLHVEPGSQPDLVRDLAWETIRFVEERGLVTVPPLAKAVWRMEMIPPDRQKVNPFFMGGEVIHVSFPTHDMTQDEKRMSLRGNNIHFSRATVHHELIPGHHLHGFMNERYNAHRRIVATPFWVEGWALYWEMLLWDLGFAQSPENRVGMLFWRMHRCARVVFSLSFHLGTMTPQECVDFLVDQVAFERNNASAEVRRSFEGSYPPLYQIAYLIGALQFRALRRELVDSGRMAERPFHDAILRTNRIPVEMVRASLTQQMLPRDYTANWRFGD